MSDSVQGKPSSENIDRRAFLERGAATGAGAAMLLLGGAGCKDMRDQAKRLTGPAPAQWTALPHDAPAVTRAAHVLNRVAFGPRPGDVARVAEIGEKAYIEEQLADRMDEDPAVTWRVGGLDTQQIERDSPDVLASYDDGEVLTQTAQAALLRAVYSRHQLREMLADFWTNHFNIYALKNDGRSLLPTDTEHVIRPHVLGTFRELLTASAHSPAMLGYLDNNQNRRKNGSENANENYARELLELHTLGVKSGYTQRDIQEVARCFTGWTVHQGWVKLSLANMNKPYSAFEYEAGRHDEDAKYIPFLNLTIAPKGGERDAQLVLERLAMHPTTAHFIARKLCRHFLGNATGSVVAQAAAAYLNSKSDIRATLRPILLDGLTDPEQCLPILKRPLDYVASSLRALAADTDGGKNLQNFLSDMGQPLYLWPMPDGFPEKSSAWASALLPRWNYALALTANKIGGTRIDLQAPLTAAKASSDTTITDTLLETVYGRPCDAPELMPVRKQIAAHVERARREGVNEPTLLAETTALLFAAPAFQWK